MTQLMVYNLKREEVGKHELPDDVYACDRYEHLFHESVRMHLASKRAGTASAKRRREVHGGGRKPWRQKGTGRARHGSTRGTQWVGGGRPHGPKPRDYSVRFPKKMRRAALRSALSRRVREDMFFLLDALEMDTPSTRAMRDVLGRFSDGKVLLVLNDKDENVIKSARNLKGVTVRGQDGLSVYDILGHNVVVTTVQAADAIATRLAP
jgi:large subunit ribosomal protein L4